MKSVLALSLFAVAACSHRPPSPWLQQADAVEKSVQNYCSTVDGVNVYVDDYTDCPSDLDLKRDIEFVLDYAHAPDSSLKGARLILIDSKIGCGVLAIGCTNLDTSVSIVDSEYHGNKLRAIMRHELYHQALYAAGSDPSDVPRDDFGRAMRKDWADVERGPL